MRVPVRASFRYKEAHGSFGSIRRFNPDLVVRNWRVNKTTRKGFSRSNTGRVLVLRRREGTPRGRRARAVREVRRRKDGDRGERPLGGDQSVHDSLREQEREAAQSYNRIGGFSSAILYRWAAVSVGTTRARKRRTYATNAHSRKVYKRSSNVQRR